MGNIVTLPIESMADAFSVKGKNVVITGGNRGIGLGISTAFAQCGANVAILCRNEASGKSVADSYVKYGGRYLCIKTDIAEKNSVTEAALRVYEFFDNVDVLVNNAGVAGTHNFFTPEGQDEWQKVIGTNLFGTANVLYSIVPRMKESGRGGSIINISSVGGQRVSGSKEHDNSAYNASKAAIDIFTRYLAVTLGDYGLRCNAIAPGPTHSDLDADLPAGFFEVVNNTLPTHRFGEGIEIGALCVFLASPAGVQVTGTVIPHDGGLLTVV